ncbi:hypothetical protein [Robbsia sp. KACC 23696]|uniref:hypothetical protein n=1 Tax=Robbsia sp. KACC 23696 TaxID=3149231 RepID=UPI00325A7F38
MLKGCLRHITDPRRGMMRRGLIALWAACCFPLAAHAQSSNAGPSATPSGTLQFEQRGREVIVTLQGATLDHFPANRLRHFDETVDAGDIVRRMVVETDAGLMLYDFRRHPPVVQTIGLRMSVRRVFWQGEEVVMQGSKGWFRFEHGDLTKLQYSKTTFH